MIATVWSLFARMVGGICRDHRGFGYEAGLRLGKCMVPGVTAVLLIPLWIDRGGHLRSCSRDPPQSDYQRQRAIQIDFWDRKS